jgi:SOUL heme-binding protein
MIMFLVDDATGQSPPTDHVLAMNREAARNLIEATLEDGLQHKEAAKQRAQYQRTCNQVTKLCSSNVVASHVLKQSMGLAEKAKDDEQAARLLSEGLGEVQQILRFKPFLEAPLPEGFPEPTPVGEIVVKKYPAYRMARTEMAETETAAFWALFTHIKKQDIAMTAPVEMTYGVGGKDKLRRQAMAFLYRSTKQGSLGQDDRIDVSDSPAMTVLSMGIRGDVTKNRLAEAKAHLDTWLKEHAKDYVASGPLRVMGYNSPFVAVNRRLSEVEVPVRQVPQSR